MSNSPPTPDFYADLRTLLKSGSASPPVENGAVGDGGLPAESATEPTVIATKRRVEVAHTRALKSLSELAKRNEEAERRAKATVHAISAKYLKALEKDPDVHEGDPLFFFGYGLECMEDILHAGFCQVNASVNLYLEELDARSHNLLVMSEEIDAAHRKAKQLADEFKGALDKIEARQSIWLDGAKGQVSGQLEGFVEARKKAESKLLERIERSNRALKRAVWVFGALVLAVLGITASAWFYIIKTIL